MIITDAIRPAGATIGLSVTASSHAAVTLQAGEPSANGLFLVNPSTTVVVYVNVATSTNGGAAPSAAAATIPGDGTAGSIPILPYQKIILAGLQYPVSITAIGSAAGPTLITATPVQMI